jgi:hypothetical protein
LFSGAVAQLGERSNRTAEVVGSIPSGSTILSDGYHDGVSGSHPPWRGPVQVLGAERAKALITRNCTGYFRGFDSYIDGVRLAAPEELGRLHEFTATGVAAAWSQTGAGPERQEMRWRVCAGIMPRSRPGPRMSAASPPSQGTTSRSFRPLCGASPCTRHVLAGTFHRHAHR